ncbi:hypothetical protein DFR56_110185 [Pseudogracilibacillus auburnensis]|uniref:Uncharacterized protein n=1 Tax=Pseudogracilibacillus auburnensis TaxID=1494959 RepID=A0A2V3WA93_9BACI|nr:hypothetical protein DFR56_110185 [Pseudogracilibacillus auburnensis]
MEERFVILMVLQKSARTDVNQTDKGKLQIQGNEVVA